MTQPVAHTTGPQHRTDSEQWKWNNIHGSGRGLIYGTLQYLLGGSEYIYENPQSQQQGLLSTAFRVFHINKCVIVFVNIRLHSLRQQNRSSVIAHWSASAGRAIAVARGFARFSRDTSWATLLKIIPRISRVLAYWAKITSQPCSRAVEMTDGMPGVNIAGTIT